MIKNKRRNDFLRLANNRLHKSLHYLKTIKNLSNTYYYDYDSEDIDIITLMLEDELDKMSKKFGTHYG
jgi:hypothetical protein